MCLHQTLSVCVAQLNVQRLTVYWRERVDMDLQGMPMVVRPVNALIHAR